MVDGPAAPEIGSGARQSRPRVGPRCGAHLALTAALAALGLAAAGRLAAAPAPTPAPLPLRPPRVVPLIHPALPGEGVWHPGTYAVDGSTPIWVTSFRPDPRNPTVVAYAAWIDARETRLALYPGYANPPTASPRGGAEVPHDQRWRLLATFNGGFKWTAGPAGFVVNGHADEPLLRGLATVVAHTNGHVDVVSWRGPATLASLAVARQNLHLLVNGGRTSGQAGDVALWGATLGGDAAVWRSALGIDHHGNLIYAAADSQTPASLATLMIHLGARRAMELDINPEWMSFNVYGKRGGRDAVQVVPNTQESAYRWLVPDSRDFFAVYTSSGGSPLVPFG